MLENDILYHDTSIALPMSKPVEEVLGSNHDHDHASCIESALDTARKVCQAHDARFTPIRQRVLELVWQSHRPVLAYDLLNQLRQEKTNAEAPTVYRALEFLLENNLIHRIESLNAYIGCNFAESRHRSHFLICTECNQCLEVEDEHINQAIATQASSRGFSITAQAVEVLGTCNNCRQAETAGQ